MAYAPLGSRSLGSLSSSCCPAHQPPSRTHSLYRLARALPDAAGFLGASAMQHKPFRATFLHWLSDEALLIVGHSFDGRHGAGVGTGRAQEGGVQDAGGVRPNLSLLVVRHDLREVLLRTELDNPAPQGPLWGCVALGADRAAAGAEKELAPQGSVAGLASGAASHVTRALPPRLTTLLLGAARSVAIVHVHVSDPTSAAGAAASPLRIDVTIDAVLPLPEECASPAGLSATATAPSKALGGPTAVPCHRSASSSADGALSGLDDSSDVGCAVDRRVRAIVGVLPLADGSVQLLLAAAASEPPTKGALPAPPLATGTALLAPPLPGAAPRLPFSLSMQPLLPPGSSQQLWHAPGVLWTLTAAGLVQWALIAPDASAADGDGGGSLHLPSLARHRCLHSALVLPPPRDVLPLAIMPAPHAVLGAAFLPAPSASAPIGPHLLAQPYAHIAIRQMLLDGHLEAALQCARDAPFRRRYCLELLLHEALLAAAKEAKGGVSSSVKEASSAEAAERDATATTLDPATARANGIGPAAGMLHRVATLVRQLGHPDWSRVAAGCARKTDAVHWPRLFAACGPPLELFHASLDQGDLRCAAALLLPLRHAEGSAACDEAVQVVRTAAEARGMGALINQLASFCMRLQG